MLRKGECTPTAGSYFGPDHDNPWFQTFSIIRLPSGMHYLFEARQSGKIDGPVELATWKQGFSLAWITLSDKGARGEREDASGPLIATMVGEALPLTCSRGFLLPDSFSELRALLIDLALVQQYDMILTTGGTGVGPRDITPEATGSVLDMELPGFERVLTAASLAKTPHAMISRARCGLIGRTLVLNLPGSPRAVRENLSAVLPAIRHTIEKAQGDPSDCG